MRQTTFRVLAVGVPLALCGAAIVASRAQTPAPASAVVPAKPAPLDRAALEKKIDELVNGYMTVNGFSGTVLLASQGKPLVAKGYGHANIEWQIPNTTKTKFRIGSITKQFTSMLVMQLREQGRAKLEDSVCVYVAPCPDAWKPVLLPAAAKQLMWTPFKNDYAYGWIIGQPAPALFGGHKRIAHAGGINGFSSVIVRLPEVNVTVIVLANNDTVNASVVGRDVMAIYYGQPYTIPAPPTASRHSSAYLPLQSLQHHDVVGF